MPITLIVSVFIVYKTTLIYTRYAFPNIRFDSRPQSYGQVHIFTYSLSDLLTIALLTFMCGGEDYVDMSPFAEVKARKFGLLAQRRGAPRGTTS